MKKIILFALVAAFISDKPTWAEETLLRFDEFVADALSNSPEAAKIDASLAERMAEAFAAGVKVNPELASSFDIPNSNRNGEKTEIAVTVSQAIRPSDFGTRTALSAVIEQTGDIEKQIALNQYIQNLRVLYARAWQYQEVEFLLGGAQKRASQFLNKVSDGAQRGIFSEGDVEIFRAEQKTFEADRIAAQGELAQTVAELTRLSGISITNKKLSAFQDSLAFSRESLGQLVKESRLPIQRRVQLLRSLAEKQLEVARLDSFPTVSPVLGYSRHDDGIEQTTVGVSISLPIFNRNQGERTRASGALLAAEKEQRYATSDAIVREVELLHDVFQSLKKQVDLYESSVIPAREKAVDAYYRQFEAGIGTALQLWQAFRELNTSKLRAIELKTSLSNAQAQLNALVGKQL